MVNVIKSGVGFVLLSLLLVSQTLQADVSASLGRMAVYDGDTVTLVIETDDRNHTGEPDLSGLQQDFDILGSRTSQQTQIINGRRTDKRQWHIELAPKNTGNVTVPAITVGNDKTLPLQLSVRDRPAALTADSGQALFLKASIEPADANVFVQQQIQYTLKLYFRESLSEGGFSGPDIDNAIVERLGEDQQYETTVKGERYQVIERHYAVFPEKSGKLAIPPVVFNGRMTGAARQRGRITGMSSMMDRFFGGSLLRAPGKRVRLRSEAVTLDVQPRPASYTGEHWLPSEQVVLNDSWAEGPPEFHAGEPSMRTITLEAKGLESSHLPDIILPEPADMRLYPEKPQHETRTDGEWVYGSSQQTVAYVPATTGRISIPAIRIDWWDTRTQQQRSTVLPAWEVNVLPGEAGSVQPPAETAVMADPAAVTRPVDNEMIADAPQDNSWSLWLLLFAGSAIVLLAVWRYRRRHARAGSAGKQIAANKQQIKTASSLLEQACRVNDPRAAANALLQWAAAKWPVNAPRNLGSLAEQLSSGGQQIRELDQALYARNTHNWQGKSLWQVFSSGLEQQASATPARQDGLLPLYPDWNAR